MRNRPPDRALTGQEVASSNTTVNALLGGRQKSWMTGAPSIVRPSPQMTFNKRPGSAILPSPAPSDEPSPIQQSQDNPATDMHTFISAQNPLDTPPLPDNDSNPTSSRLNHAEAISAHDTTLHPPQKRQKVNSSQPDVPSLKPQIEIIDKYIRSAGGFSRLNPACEQPRFSLLRDACNNQDYFYLALHQVFCLWSIDRQTITSIDGVPDSNALSYSLNILGQLIRENSGLSPVHLKWFSKFPGPLPDLMRQSQAYRLSVMSVSTFLSKLSSEWTRFTMHCQQRGYPPLVDELANQLGLLSPVLQGVFFTATRRNMGILEDDCGAQMEKIFNVDRDEHRQFAARRNSSLPPSTSETQERNNNIIKQYLTIRKQFQDRQSLRRQSSSSAARVIMNQGPPLGVPTLGTFSTMPNVQPSSSRFTGRITHPSQSPHVLSSNIEQTYQGNISSTTPYPNPGHQASSYPVYSSGYSLQHNPNFSVSQQTGIWNAQAISTAPVSRPAYNRSPLHNHNLPVNSGTSQYIPASASATTTAMAHQNLPQLPQRRQPVMTSSDSSFQRASRPANILTSVDAPTRSTTQAGSASPGVFQYTPMLASIPSARSSPAVQPPMQTQSLKNRGDNALIPPKGYVLPVQPPNPDFTALHQAHLRSPLLVVSKPPSYPELLESTMRFYQVIKTFAVGPVALSRELTLSRFTFSVPSDVHAKIARDRASKTTGPMTRDLRQGSLQFRMRCIRCQVGEQKQESSTWVVTDTVWPPSVFLEINDNVLEVRRKQHHAKDLPVDITPYVLAREPNRRNHINISIPKTGKHSKEMQHIFAVEVIEVLKHDQIMDMCLQRQRIPASETLNNIKRSLAGALDESDDDEIVMVASDLSIDLADPYMAKIFDVPVRGKTCLHRECFDLETFLNTRPSKPKHPDQPSMVDVWKCPLCGRDARPYSLRVDEFLLSVREKLARDGMLDCRAILVAADGSWRVKPDSMPSNSGQGDDSSDDDEEAEREIRSRSRQVQTNGKGADIVVIDD